MSDEVPFDPQEFRHALGSFTTGVTVVTTKGTEDNDVGLTANSFNSVSLDPPMVLWSLGKSAMSMDHFKAAEYFAVHILSEDQEELSSQFARRGIDKFAGVDIERGPENIPLLKNCAARFTCKTAYQYEGGDHIIFVGEVLDFNHWERLPLLFHAGQYGQIVKDLDKDDPEDQQIEMSEGSLAYLLRTCAHQIMAPLKRELAGNELSVAQYYLLALLAKYGGKSEQEAMAMLDKGGTVLTHEDIQNLVDRQLIQLIDGSLQLTSAGSRLHVELVSHFKASESAALNELDYEARQVLTLSLIKLIENTK